MQEGHLQVKYLGVPLSSDYINAYNVPLFYKKSLQGCKAGMVIYYPQQGELNLFKVRLFLLFNIGF